MAQRSTDNPTRRRRRPRPGQADGRPTSSRRRGSTDGRGRASSSTRRPRTSGQRERVSSERPRKRQGSSARNTAVDGFRALAIIAVLLYHLDVPWLPSGHLGVVMFLVLTGYLITSSLLRRMREGLSAIPRFWISRLARIWPSAAVMIVFTVLACVIGNHVLLTKARPDILPGFALCENLSYILRGVSYFDQIGGPSPLTHLWYLGIDAQFSLIWPIVMALCALLPSRTTTRRLTLVAAVASAVAMGVLYNPDTGITRVYYGPDTRFFAPLLGAWLAYVMPLGRRPARDVRPLLEQGRLAIEIGALVALVALGIAMALVPDTSILLYRGGMFVAALLSCLFLAALVLPGGILSAVLGAAPLAWLGSRSFGIYLWHYPLIQLLGAARNDAAWWKPLLVIVLSLVLGELSYRLIEQPVGALLSPRPPEPAARRQRNASMIPAPIALAGAGVLAIALIADGVGLALIEPETLVPEDAIVSTGEDAGHAMDLSKTSTTSTTEQPTTSEPVPDTPPADAVLHAPAAEKEAGIYDPVLIGDSVPGDAKWYWDMVFPDGLMDSYVGRRPDQAVTVLDEYLAQGVVGQVVILQAFSNVPATTDQVEHMIQACGPDRDIYIVNVRIPEVEETQINSTLAQVASAHENVTLIDWHAKTESYNDWIYPDGEHLTPSGQPVYIDMLLEAIYTDYTDAGGTITRRNDASDATTTTDATTSDTSAATGDTTTSTDASESTNAAAEGAATETDAATTTGTTTQASTGMVIGDSAQQEVSAPTQTASMRILMLGNSFTYYNDMPAMLASLTDAEVVTHARGKANLAAQLTDDDQMGATTLAALEEGGWDYVILQEMSSRPIRAHSQDFIDSVNKLAELARACGATPIIFATWPYNEGASRLDELGLSREEMATQLNAAFATAADSSGALVADVESAFTTASSHELLYAQDGVHPSVIGSKLAAEVIAQTIEDDQAQRAA